jgi:1-acyl-sn-glycerol-3-phosphate acyltransferase
MMRTLTGKPSVQTVFAPPAAAMPARDPIDFDWLRTLVTELLGPIADAWFRAELVGAERIPEHGPLILASNHSGNAFPYDGIVLDGMLWRRDGMREAAKVRTVYEHQLSLVWWMRPFGIANFWRRGGGVDMTFDNFERLLQRGDRVLYFPEGVPGIGKGFNHRYELQRFHTSFALLAARHDVPVIPLYIVGGEWVHPFGYTFAPLDWVMARVFTVPFLPLPIGLLAIVFPWMWYLAFPAKLTFVLGAPVDVKAAMRAEGIVDFEAPPREALQRAAERLRVEMQRGLREAVATPGTPRYGFRSLWRALRDAGPRRWRAIPTGWPLAFLRHERDRWRDPARSRLHAIVRDLDLVAFYLPFGWPLLSLARAFRKPAYGHRGVSREARRESEGELVWRLRDRPLPPRR